MFPLFLDSSISSRKLIVQVCYYVGPFTFKVKTWSYFVNAQIGFILFTFCCRTCLTSFQFSVSQEHCWKSYFWIMVVAADFGVLWLLVGINFLQTTELPSIDFFHPQEGKEHQRLRLSVSCHDYRTPFWPYLCSIQSIFTFNLTGYLKAYIITYMHKR